MKLPAWLRWTERVRRHPGVAREGTARLREALRLVLCGNLEGAEAVLADLARSDSSATDVYLALANVYRARGEIGRAIQIHQNLLLRPELPDEVRSQALLGLAFDFRAGGFLGRAAASLEEFLEGDPHNLDALRELERLQLERGEIEAAIQLRRRIGSRDPHTPRVRAHLFAAMARRQIAAEQLPEAQRSLRRALGSDRSCAEVYIVFGDLCMRDSKPQKAIDLYVRALPLHPRAGVLVYPKLRDAHEQTGDLAAFAQILSQRADQVSEDVDARLWHARALLGLGRTDDGLAQLRRLIDQMPDLYPAYTEMGRALLAGGRAEEAVKVVEELLSRIPSLAPRLRCSRCGSAEVTLHFRCPHCGEWDSIG